MATLEPRPLGEFELESASGRRLPTRKAEALLAYLALPAEGAFAPDGRRPPDRDLETPDRGRERLRVRVFPERGPTGDPGPEGDHWRGRLPGGLWSGGFNGRGAWTWTSTTHPFPPLQACRCRAVGAAPSMPSSGLPVSSPRRRPPRPRTELDKHRPRPRCP